MNGQVEVGSDAVALASLKPYLESVFMVEANKTSPSARIGFQVKKSHKWKVFFVSEVKEDSIFIDTRVKTGDILLAINGKVCPDNLPDILSTMAMISGSVQLTLAATKPAFEIEDTDEEKGEVTGRRLSVFEHTKRKTSDKLGFTIDISKFKNPGGSNQLVVTRVQPNGNFSHLKRGSILRSVNGKPCTDYKKTVKILRSSKTLSIAVEEPLRPSIANAPHDNRKSIMFGRREIKIETPPKGVIIIWSLIAIELLFDLVTTAIAFMAFFAESRECCNEEIDTGVLRVMPLATSIPFAFLVLSELLFLLRAMRLTMWPPNLTHEELDPNRSCFSKLFCGSNPGIMIFAINLLTIINPYCGFIIAWMLIYQSDEREAFFVIGMECVSIILHFISVHYEGQARTFANKVMHSLVILPFLATGVLLSWFLQVKGICYNSDLELFWFDGCEVCPNGLRPENGYCSTTTLMDGVNTTVIDKPYLWNLEQSTTCDENTGLKMCFFPSQ